MIFTIFMKRLILDTSSATIRRVTSILDENKIKYTLKTIRPRGAIGTGTDARSYAQLNFAMYKGSVSPVLCIPFTSTGKTIPSQRI